MDATYFMQACEECFGRLQCLVRDGVLFAVCEDCGHEERCAGELPPVR